LEDKIRQLEGVCGKEELAEIKILQHALYKTVNAYRDDSSAPKLRDWEAAREGLARTVARLQEKYFPTEPVFETRRAAFAWLKDQGYKISIGKFYQDCAKGLCAVGQDGTIRESAVIAYALQQLPKVETEDGKLVPKQAEKLDEEIAHIRARRQNSEFDLEHKKGQYLPRKDFGLELAARAGVLEQGLRNFIRTRMVDLISMCAGDPGKLPTLVDFFNQELDALLTEYASVERFHVLFEEAQA
jgi:hypothetical protein